MAKYLVSGSHILRQEPSQMHPVAKRNFSASIEQSTTMTLDQGRILHEYQERFEHDPNNIDAAYKLFRELNKHGMYLTVIRLYWKHELDQKYR